MAAKRPSIGMENWCGRILCPEGKVRPHPTTAAPTIDTSQGKGKTGPTFGPVSFLRLFFHFQVGFHKPGQVTIQHGLGVAHFIICTMILNHVIGVEDI